MKNSALFILVLLLFGSCGPNSPKKMGGTLNDFSSPMIQPGISSTFFTPGSYFKVMNEVGSNKDTRVYEFQFLSNKKFIITETSFQGGDLTKAYFHKKTGTFSEPPGAIYYTTTYDTCGDLKLQTTYMSGDKNNFITVIWNGNTSRFYSYSSWSLPSDISSHITDAVEDVGCKIFQD